MNFGHFDDANKEYVITNRIPAALDQLLGSQDSFPDFQYLRRYSFYKDAKLLRITRYRYNNIPVDSNGKYYYIRTAIHLEPRGQCLPARLWMPMSPPRSWLQPLPRGKNGLAAGLF